MTGNFTLGFSRLTLVWLLWLGAFVAQAQVPPGNALNFDGADDYIVSISSGSYFNYTVEAWVRTTNAATGDGGTIVSNYPNFSVGMYGGKARFRSYNTVNTTYDLVGTTLINDGKWHHVAAVMGGGINYNMTLYVDGVAEGSRTGGRTDVSSTYVGTLYGSNDFWQGSIDEVRIWDAPHSAAEIKTFFNNAVPPTQPGLLMNYTFDRGTAGGNNAGQTTEPNPVPRACGGCFTYTGTLYNFALSGSTSNLIESYALMQPKGLAATSAANGTSLSVTWTPPPVGTVSNYVLDVSTTADFSAGVTTLTPAGSASSATVPGRTVNTLYYLRLKTDKASVTGQSAYSRDVTNLRTGSGLTPPGNALAFDGTDDYVHMTGALPATGEFTLEAWVNPTTFSGGLDALLMADDFPAGAIHCQFYGNNLGFTINGNSPADVISASALSAGRWSHVAVVYSASARTVKFYVNGVLNTTAAYASAQAIAATPYSLGGWQSSGVQRLLTGRLDEVRIYNTTLTQAQVQADMRSTTAAVPPSLAAYYDFDAGTAGGANTTQTTLPDRSPNYQDGTLKNFSLLSGNTTSNWVESYALVVPTLAATTGVTTAGFTANWTAPAVGIVNSYVLDYSLSPTFATVAGTLSPAAGAGSQAVSGLLPNRNYYYRVRADKTSGTVAGTGAYASGTVRTASALTPPGNALAFDGSDDYVSCSPQANLQYGTGDFTMEAWLRDTRGGAAPSYVAAVASGANTWLGMYFGYAAFSLSGTYFISTVPINDGHWHHVAGARRNGVFVIYVDGVASRTQASSQNISTGNGYTIGGKGSTGEWMGQIDEVRSYNVGLTAAQVRADMTSTSAAVPASLMAYYNFDQGTAGGSNATVTTLTDQSATPTDGTLSNFDLSSGNTTSNWVESYALVVPTLTASTGASSTGFTANWTAPAIGVVDNGYRLDVATSSSFAAAALVGGSPITVAAGTTSQAVTGLAAGQTYYYRVRADKTSVTGTGAGSLPAIQRPLVPMSPPGNALAFDGSDDFVAVATNPALDNLGTASFTMEAWVYYTGGSGAQSILRKTGDYNLYLNGNTLHAEVWPNGIGNSAWRLADGTTALPANRWVHVAAVWNSTATTCQLYVNGVADGTGITSSGTIGGSEGLYLGFSSIYSNPLNGRLDEVRIYNTALTAAQVQADMTSTNAAVPASLQLYYNFDHGTASGDNAGYTTVADQSANLAHGTLTNFNLTTGNTTSNWVESYALLVPTNLAATPANGTTINTTWTAPTINGAVPAAGIVEGYVLDVSTSATFASAVTSFSVSGYATTSTAATGLTNGTTYYLRLRAEKASVTGQGYYTPTISTRIVGTDAKLTSLVPSAGVLGPVFAPATLAYTLYVPTGTTTYTLTPTASNSYTAITVNGTTVANGTASAALNVGSTATVVLTSEDLLTTTTYTVQTAAAPGYFRSVATGNWGDASTWEASNDGSANWFAAPVAPTGSFVGTVAVRNGHTVTVAAATSTKTTTVESGGILNTLNGQTLTIPSGATMTVSAGGVLSIGRLSGADGVTGTSANTGVFSVAGTNALTVNGTLVLNLGAATNTPVSQGINTSTTTIGNGGRVVYYATVTNIAMPAPIWSAGSTLELAGGITGQTYAIINQTLQNLDVNLTSLPTGTATATFPYLFSNSATVTVAGTLTVRSTGLGTLRLFNAPTGSLTLGTVDGSGNRTGGYVQLAGTSVVGSFGSTTATAGTPITVQGSFQLNGGTFAAAQGSSTTTNTLRATPLTVNGDFVVASGATFNLLSGAANTTINYTGGTVALNGSFRNAGTVGTGNTASTTQKLLFGRAGTAGAQTFSNPGTITGLVNAQVAAGTTLDLGTQAFTGAGTFTTVNGSTLRLGSPVGISASSTATGNVQSTGTRTFAGVVEFNSTTAQVTGTGFPATLAGTATLVFNNPAGVTLSQALSVPGTLSLKQGVVTTSATNLLTLGTGTGVTGSLDATATNTGIIVGPFKRWIPATTGARTFPVGTPTQLRPAAISFTAAPTTAGSLTAEFIVLPSGNQGLPLAENGITINKASASGYWRVAAADGLAGGTYTPSFTFTGASGILDYTQLVLLKRADPSADWALVGTHVPTAGTNAAPVLSRTGMSGFSDFTAGGDLLVNPLPVELTAFTAQVAGPAAVRLAWATASEKNSAAFEVERSLDGRSFVRIGTVAAVGTSSSPRSYELLDAKLPAGAARLYYRLKQMDLDGTFRYSPVRTVALSSEATMAELALFPNPARSGAATLTGAQPGAVVTVYDALGREVTTATADATGTAALVLPAGLPSGVYVVRAGSQALRLTVE